MHMDSAFDSPFASTPAQRMVSLRMAEVSGVDAPANEEPGWMVLKALHARENRMPINLEALDPEVRAHIESVTAERDAAVTKAAAAPAASPDADDDTVEKGGLANLKGKKAKPFGSKKDDEEEGSPEEEASESKAEEDDEEKAMAKAWASLPAPVAKAFSDLQARTIAAETVAKAEQNRRLTAEYVAKAAEFDSLGIDPETFGPVLRKAAEALGEEALVIFDVLKTANDTAATAELFTGIGSSGTQGPASGNAYGQLEAIAKAAVANDPALTFPDAFAKAVDANPALYSAHLKEA